MGKIIPTAELMSKNWTGHLSYLTHYLKGDNGFPEILTVPGSVWFDDPKIGEFRKFLKLVSIGGDPSFDENSLVLLLNTLGFISKALPSLPHLVDIFYNDIGRLNKYLDNQAIPQLVKKNTCFYIVSWSLSYLTKMMELLPMILSRNQAEYEVSLNGIHHQLDILKSYIDKAVRQLKEEQKLCELYHRLRSSSTVSETSNNQGNNYTASPTCYMNPASKTDGSFDYTDEFDQMDRFFNGGDKTAYSFRSLTLHGSCGINRSVVAWNYAQEQLRNNKLHNLFWVPMEKITNIFTEFAMGLQLPDAHTNSHEENKISFFCWLFTTKRRWMLVFENVESVDSLTGHWPRASRGQAIITTRDPDPFFYPTDGGLEITGLDLEEGTVQISKHTMIEEWLSNHG